MSFDPIIFTFTPPPTIPSAAVPAAPIVDASSIEAPAIRSSIADASKATALINRLAKLKATSQYLQQAVLARNPTLGVSFNFESNPDLGRAIGRIYSVDEPPSSMDLQMFTNLLDAEIAIMRFDLANPIDSTIDITPLQRADLILSTRAFEHSLASTGDFSQSLPLLLRDLRTDEVVFDNLTNSLSDYAILRNTQLNPLEQIAQGINTASDRTSNSSSTDVSSDLNDTMNQMMDGYQFTYGHTYNLLAAPDITETDLPNIVNIMSPQTSIDLGRIDELFNLLINVFHKPTLNDIVDNAGRFVVPRLISEMSFYSTGMDQFDITITQPTRTIGGALGGLLNEVGRLTSTAQLITPRLTGIVDQSSGKPISAKLQSGPSTLTAGGLNSLIANIDWASNLSQSKNLYVRQSLVKLTNQKLWAKGDLIETLATLKTITTAQGVIKGLLNKTSGSLPSLDPSNPTQNVETFAQLVKTLDPASGSSLSIDASTLVIIPPDVPTPPTDVAAVLQAAGVVQLNTDTLRIPIGVV